MTKTQRCILAIGLLLFLPQPLRAQAVAGDDATVQSRLHFDRGVQLYREGSLDSALAEFSRAYEIVHDYRLLYNVAQVQAERHDYVQAIEVFADYLRQGGAAIPKERRVEIDSETARLRQRVGELWISSSTPGAEVWVNNRLAAKLPLTTAILVNAGPYTVRVTSPGHKPFTRELQVAGGDRTTLDVELDRDAPAGPTGTKVARSNTWLWLSLTATGAFAAGSVAFGLATKNANQALDNRLNEFPANPGRIEDTRKTIRTDALTCDILAGAAVLGAGTSLYFLLTPSYEPTPKSGASGQKATARLVPSPTGIILDGRF